MKNKTLYPFIIATIFIVSLAGCGTLDKNLGIAQWKTNRLVENNVFTSSFPEMKLQISQELKYLGSVQLTENTEKRMSATSDPNESSAEATAYLFGQIDQKNRIAKGVLIQLLVMHGNPSQALPKMFSRTSNHILGSGEMKILDEQYHYDLYTEQELFTQKEQSLLPNDRVPSCFLVKKLSIRAGLGNKSRAQVLYFEDISDGCGNRPCGTCIDPVNGTAEQKKLMQGFTDRSFASIRFIKTKNIEDKTSRYVDAEPNIQTFPAAAPVILHAAPAEKAPSVAESTKTDVLEKRLESLKRIYEKNLISKEDYEKKKAEILKEL